MMTKFKNFRLLAFVALMMTSSSCRNVTDAQEGAFFNVPSNQHQQTPSDTLTIYLFSPQPEFTGNLGGRTGADQICESNLPFDLIDKGYKVHALLGISANDDLNSFPSSFGIAVDQPIFAFGSEMRIADDWSDFLNGSIDNTMKNAGLLQSNTIYWTGFDPDGRLSQDNCKGFTQSAVTESGQIGNSDYNDVRWSAFQADTCDIFHPILCIAF